MAEIINEMIIKPTDGTRWVDHCRRAVEAFVRNFPAVVGHLNEVSSMERQDIRREDST